ncbi:MAG: glycosyltransferase [Cyanobacteria bacterium J06560_5]
MKIGYLHIGPPEHGLHRYSRLLAAAANQRQDCSVTEVSAELKRSWQENRRVLRQAAKDLSSTDIVHLQHNSSLWGKGLSVINLRTFICHCRAPVVVTLHDVYWQQVPFSPGKAIFYLKAMYGSSAIALRYILHAATKVFICTKQERNRLASVTSIHQKVKQKVQVIPHFVEERTLEVDRDRSRQLLGLEDRQIVTLLGWIHPRKGHRLVVEALPQLPDTVDVVFAGRHSQGGENFLKELIELAERLGVRDRITITGYLTEPELEQYLIASDIAVCPFKSCSASGSLSTWISVAHPKILASNLPQIQEYNHLEEAAIHTFERYDSMALAQAIESLLEEQSDTARQAIEQLQHQLRLSTVFSLHQQQMQNVLKPSHQLTTAVAEDPPLKIVFAPWYSGQNPYQKRLSDQLKALSITVEGTRCSTATLLKTVEAQQADILHLHWLQHFFLRENSRLRALLKLVLFLTQLAVLRLKGIKIVWTVHNLVNHQERHIILDKIGTFAVSRLAHRLIVHSQTAETEIREALGVKKPIDVTPHASYIDVYENTLSPASAREILQISESTLVFLFLGYIHPYKGTIALAEAFKQLQPSNCSLLIVGKPKDSRLDSQLHQIAQHQKNIIYTPGFVPDEKIQLYMNAADIVALPYREFLTSGAVSLAMSFGKACLAPNIGSIGELLNDKGAFLYDPSEEEGLTQAITAASKAHEQLKAMGEHNLQTARTKTWQAMAEKTFSIYQEAIAR